MNTENRGLYTLNKASRKKDCLDEERRGEKRGMDRRTQDATDRQTVRQELRTVRKLTKGPPISSHAKRGARVYAHEPGGSGGQGGE